MLEDLIWKYQILAFEHVIFALMRGNRDCDHGKHKSTLGFLDYLLFQSEGFSSRVKHLMSLNFNHRYWAEDDYHEKLMKYLEQYPEFFEFEAFAMKGYETVKEILEPPSAIHMPIYYSNVITRTLPILDLLISRLIELEEKEILAKLLDNYGCLYPYHQTLLSYVRDLFHYYYQSETIRDPVISKKLVHLLDLNEYDIAPELLQYAKDENFPENLFDENYFHRVFHKLADYMSPKKCAPKSDPKQPERHYCEIANPVVQALYIACIEILASPIEPQHIVTAALNTVLGRDLKNVAVQPIVIHAIALLFSFLPIDIFLLGAFNELITVIKTDPNLLQNSSSCTLERQSFKDPRIPPTQSTFNSTPQPLPFQPLFASLSLEDMLRPVGLNSDPFSSESEPNKTMMFPYIFNDYLFNLYNYGTNVPNSFLTFIHSLLHYSNTDMLEVLFTNLMARGDGGITTDIQVLYMCALVGPVLHRLDKSPLVLKQFLLHILELLHEVTSHMRTEEITVGKSTEALEQIYDFLNHVKPLLDSDPDFMHQIQNIVRLMKPPVQNRLCGFICQA
ncbi:hypothetical protein G9A89_012219 [Geosiphon pyriformis]|nr:hypothetical protein G9A89_012219 [Geosiphon pyriformis]